MIVDDIIAFFVGLVEVAVGFVAAVIFLINGIAALLEFVLGLFINGIVIGRIKQPGRKEGREVSLVGPAITWVMILVAVFYFFAWPKLIERELQIITSDGRPVTLALIEFEKNDSLERLRTNLSGEIKLPRFGLERVTMKDSRYVEKEWRGEALDMELIVERTVLGAGLDSLKDKLLKPFSEKESE